jgi:hypothetical protein
MGYWSGRPGSNRRRPAWEIDPRLKIKNLASMASIECDRGHPVSNDLLLRSLKGAKVEQKIFLDFLARNNGRPLSLGVACDLRPVDYAISAMLRTDFGFPYKDGHAGALPIQL